ncbi:MAG: hypothetical protein ABIO36_01210 [Pyrinomonadaceae bacterium]
MPVKQTDSSPSFDPLIQTENIAFAGKDLIACKSCGRLNPPHRLNCLYCGKGIEFKNENEPLMKPTLRKLEAWENGFNVIVRENAQIEIVTIAQFLSMEPIDLRSILDTESPLPLARVESETEASIIRTRLERCGLESTIVSDGDLAADKLPVRLSGIDFHDGRMGLKHFNTGETVEVASGDLALIVPGMLTVSRVDSFEKKRRRGNTKLVGETATSSDESVLDIYDNKNSIGFRVHLTGFDFSCLGDDKGLLAVENLRLLIVRLKEHAPNARLVTNYLSVKQALSHVWEIESRKDSQGLMRSGFGKREFGSVASSSNLNQFTKYSRLQWHLL